MNPRPSLLILLSLAFLFGGCLFHRKKVEKPKDNPEIATEVEQTFRQRWIAKRMGELQAAGVTDPRQARQQAADEFKAKYEYLNSANKSDPVGGATP